MGRDDRGIGQGSTGADQRHPGPVQDRIRQDGRVARHGRAAGAGRQAGARLRGAGPRQGADPVGAGRSQGRGVLLRPAASGTGAAELHLERAEIHRTGAGGAAYFPGGAGDRAVGAGQRHRHRRQPAGDRVRGVPAGGRHHLPPLRRNGAGPVDLPRIGRSAGRAHHADQRARQGQHLHADPARRPGAAIAGTCAAVLARAHDARTRADDAGRPAGGRGRPRGHRCRRPGDAGGRGRSGIRPHPLQSGAGAGLPLRLRGPSG